MLPALFAASLVASDSCNRPVQMVKAAQAEYPGGTEMLGSGLLEVIIRVTIDENGKFVKDELVESSGYDVFDKTVVRAAQESTYEPAIIACAPSQSEFFFEVQFRNPDAPDDGEITPPTFAAPDGWAIAPAFTPLSGGMNTVVEYTRGSERLLIAAEQPGKSFDGPGAAQHTLSVLHVQPIAAQNRTMQICGGFQQAWSEKFDYTDGTASRSAELIEVQGANGRFSLLYTQPKNAPDDQAIERAIGGFCVQGAPRATPSGVLDPAG
jgi:TonB family protein